MRAKRKCACVALLNVVVCQNIDHAATFLGVVSCAFVVASAVLLRVRPSRGATSRRLMFIAWLIAISASKALVVLYICVGVCTLLQPSCSVANKRCLHSDYCFSRPLRRVDTISIMC